MTQQEHLTTEQLSAFLDKQLTPQEQAFFDAHLQKCQRCQDVLAELRGTLALLHAMPDPSLPRSFTLPAAIAQEPVLRPQPVPLPAQRRRVPHYILRGTMRTVSALAAVVAVLFILSGLPLGFHGGGATSNGASAPAFTSANATQSTQVPAAGTALSPQAQRGTPVKNDHQNSTPTRSPVASTPTPTSTSGGTTPGTQPSSPTLPPYLDMSQPTGRLLLGTVLLILGIVGLIATRRRSQIVG